MKRELALEEIRKGLDNRLLGRLTGSEVVVGRDANCSISLENTAVSRYHGVFQGFQDHCFYKDLGSTNGSWLNGFPLVEGQWRLVRAGDLMQIADVAVRIIEASTEGPNVSAEGSKEKKDYSFIVFSNGAFLNEYPALQNGGSVTIGGAAAMLALDGFVDPKSCLTIESKGKSIVAQQHGVDGEVFLNGEPIVDSVTLVDRDILLLRHYSVIFNDPFRITGQIDSGWEDSDDPWSDDGP